MPAKVFSDVQTVGGFGNFDVRPPAGYDWEVTDVGASVWVGVAPAGRPEVNVGIVDAAGTPAWVLQNTDIRGWDRRQQLHISRTNWLRLNNPNVAARNYGFSVIETLCYGAGTSRVITDVQTIGIGANMDIIPPVGFEYEITDFGASLWVGGAPLNLPDCNVSIFDGLIAAQLMLSTDIRGWFKEKTQIMINNAHYLRMTNTNAAANVLAVVGKVARIYGRATSVVITDVVTVGAGGAFTVRPAVGVEWIINDVGASQWVGVPPASLPNVRVDLTDGIIAATMARSVDIKDWVCPMEIHITNDNFITITDLSGFGGNICISGWMSRLWMG